MTMSFWSWPSITVILEAAYSAKTEGGRRLLSGLLPGNSYVVAGIDPEVKAASSRGESREVQEQEEGAGGLRRSSKNGGSSGCG